MTENINRLLARVRCDTPRRLPHVDLTPRRGDASLGADWTKMSPGLAAAMESRNDPNYPRVKAGPVDGQVLCEHCESFGSDFCPRHRPRMSSTASGLLQII